MKSLDIACAVFILVVAAVLFTLFAVMIINALHCLAGCGVDVRFLAEVLMYVYVALLIAFLISLAVLFAEASTYDIYR